jgi:hypothetical protein
MLKNNSKTDLKREEITAANSFRKLLRIFGFIKVERFLNSENYNVFKESSTLVSLNRTNNMTFRNKYKSFLCSLYDDKVKKIYIKLSPQQAMGGYRVVRCRQGCHFQKPTALNPHKCFSYSFLLDPKSTPGPR